jgi:hypothetical protein
MLENKLTWAPGSIDTILAGGEPEERSARCVTDPSPRSVPSTNTAPARTPQAPGTAWTRPSSDRCLPTSPGPAGVSPAPGQDRPTSTETRGGDGRVGGLPVRYVSSGRPGSIRADPASAELNLDSHDVLTEADDIADHLDRCRRADLWWWRPIGRSDPWGLSSSRPRNSPVA